MPQDRTPTSRLATGNCNDATDTRGWIVGAFLSPAAWPRHTDGVEVKWGMSAAGERRAVWTDHESRATIAILISGCFTIETSEGGVTLSRPGDYVAWGSGVTHSWVAEEDSIIVTVRWPSPAPDRKPCRRWAPWRCDLRPSAGRFILKCIYCGREEIP